jgi:hypothetical protein
MSELYLKPTNPKSTVRMPERGGAVMPPHGAKVNKTPYWAKRLRDGSVVPTTAEAFEQGEKGFRIAAQAEARKAHEEAVKAQKKQANKGAPGTNNA